MNIIQYFASIAPRHNGAWADFDDQGFDRSREVLVDRACNSGKFDDLPIIDIDDAAAEYMIDGSPLTPPTTRATDGAKEKQMTERPTNPPESRDRDDLAEELYEEFSEDPGAAIEELIENDITASMFAVKTLAAMCDPNSVLYTDVAAQFMSGRWIERRMREADE